MTLRSIRNDDDLKLYCENFNCDESDIAALKRLIGKGMDFKIDVVEKEMTDFVHDRREGKGTLVDTLPDEDYFVHDRHYQDMYCNMFGIDKPFEVRCEKVDFSVSEVINRQNENMNDYVHYISDEAHYNAFAESFKVERVDYADSIAELEENKPKLTEEQKALILEKYKSDLKKLKGE